MKMSIKLVFFILMLTVVLLEAKLNLWGNLAFSRKTIINYLFPKDPGIVRVRNPEEMKTVKNVTTLDFIGLVKRHGYFAEEHYVTTEDGYNLVIHRISRSPLSNNQRKRKIVFVQHGILCTSDCWVLIGPGKDLELFRHLDNDITSSEYKFCTFHSLLILNPYEASHGTWSDSVVGCAESKVIKCELI